MRSRLSSLASLALQVAVLAAAAGCQPASEIEERIDATNRFGSLAELLANSYVQWAVRNLPAGNGVASGKFYEGTTPDDVSGTWSTGCCGGQGGEWPTGNGFGGTFTYEVVGPDRIDMPSAYGKLDTTNGEGSFIVGTGDRVTLFLQLAIRCKDDGEVVRAVAIDRFIHDDLVLRDYVRSYVVLERGHAAPWKCFIQPVGSGAVSTPARFGSKH